MTGSARLVASVVLCFPLACSSGPGEPWREFGVYLDMLTPRLMDEYRVPGVAVAIVEKGVTVYARGFGHTDKGLAVPVTDQTVFNVGSISKTATAWGVMRLVEEGRVQLDAPVRDYVPDWRPPASGFDISGVTVRRLLSHTAGTSMRSVRMIPPGQPEAPLDAVLSGDDNGRPGVRIAWEPGSGWRYSGGGYGLLQQLIEKTSGRPFSTYMREDVFGPLQMESAHFRWTQARREKAAVPYGITGEPVAYRRFEIPSAAALSLHLADLSRFVESHFDRPDGSRAGGNVLAPETVTLMQTSTPESDGAYGLGYFLEDLPDGTRAVGHDGSNAGWNAIFQTLPDQRAGFVVMTNSSHGIAITNRIRREWYEWKTGSEAPPEYYRPPLTTELLVALYQKGVAGAVDRYGEIRGQFPALQPSEGYLNFLAYDLLESGDADGAMDLLLLIVELFPGSVNALDSLAEGYEAVGRIDLAISTYGRILETQDDNAEALANVRRLQATGAPNP